MAKAGDTLWVVDHGDVQIVAVPNEGGFGEGQPDWKPDAYGSITPEDEVRIQTMTEDETISGRISQYIAGDDFEQDPKVTVVRIQPVTAEIGEIPLDEIREFLLQVIDAVKFEDEEGGEVQDACGPVEPISVDVNAEEYKFKSSPVEKFKSNRKGKKEEFIMEMGASITGKIYHPQFTGTYTLPGLGISVCSRLYAGASAGITLSANFSADESAENTDWKVENMQAELAFSLIGGFNIAIIPPGYIIGGESAIKLSIKPRMYYLLENRSILADYKFEPATATIKIVVQEENDLGEYEDVFPWLPSYEIVLIKGFQSPPYTIYTFN